MFVQSTEMVAKGLFCEVRAERILGRVRKICFFGGNLRTFNEEHMEKERTENEGDD